MNIEEVDQAAGHGPTAFSEGHNPVERAAGFPDLLRDREGELLQFGPGWRDVLHVVVGERM